MREASQERNAAASSSEKRAADALEVLRDQALALGLTPRQAAALTTPAAAAREVAHRLHFCGRRRESLERALQALETWLRNEIAPMPAATPHPIRTARCLLDSFVTRAIIDATVAAI